MEPHHKCNSSVTSTEAPCPDDFTLDVRSHIQFFLLHLACGLPCKVEILDFSRMVVLYFVVSGLDLLRSLDQLDKRTIIEWIYAKQVLPTSSNADAAYDRRGGFRPCLLHNSSTSTSPAASSPTVLATSGSPSSSSKSSNTNTNTTTTTTSSSPSPRPPCLGGGTSQHSYDVGHITVTQCALASLRILGDDLSRVDREGIIHHIRSCQGINGNFKSVCFGSEQDVRFIYSACVISELLGDYSGIDIDRTVSFIAACQNYDGGIGDSPGAESHGGTTYCAVSSLNLLHRLDVLDIPRLLRWIVMRHEALGFNGRPNKLEDTCYCFWLGCTLAQLNALDLVDATLLRRFTLICQAPV